MVQIGLGHFHGFSLDTKFEALCAAKILEIGGDLFPRKASLPEQSSVAVNCFVQKWMGMPRLLG